jgi:hypothetical protein
MGHADLAKGLTANQPVLAHRAEQSRQHLIAAGAVMAVEQNDFRHLFTGNLAFTAQAQHVFCVFTFALVAHTGLAGEERLKAFPLQVIQQGDGGNAGIAFTAGCMFSSLNTLGT